MSHGHLQIGYHGCDIAVRDGLISGQLNPKPSNNQYDWLGSGFYLFEADQERALAFAETAASEPLRRLTARPIASPAVVGCIFSIQRCLDMTTSTGRREFENAHLYFQATHLRSGQRTPLHVQIALRDFSCIKGWFLPADAELLSPAELVKAQAALNAAREANPKSRRRVEAD